VGGTVSPGNEESAHRPVGAGWWRVALILLLVGLLVRSVLASGGEGFTTGSVQALYLSSYDQRMTWCREILRGIEETLQPDSNHIVLDVFNMDSKRYREPAYFDRIRDLLAEKYRGARFSLLLCSTTTPSISCAGIAIHFFRVCRSFSAESTITRTSKSGT